MTNQEEIEFERERIRKLVTSLANVLETIRGSSTEVGSTLAQLKDAHVALDNAKVDLAQTSVKVVNAVVEVVDGLPASISKKILEELDGAIAATISNSVERLNLASGKAAAAAKTLQEAITANWAASRQAALRSGAIAGAVSGAIVSIAAGIIAYVLRAAPH